MRLEHRYRNDGFFVHFIDTTKSAEHFASMNFTLGKGWRGAAPHVCCQRRCRSLNCFSCDLLLGRIKLFRLVVGDARELA